MTMTPVQEELDPGIPHRHWPPPATVPTMTTLAAAAGAGLVGAVVLVVGAAGISWLVTGLAVAGAALVAARRRPTPGQLVWGLAALALLAMGALRAGWLFAYCVVGALLAGSLALAGGRTARGLALGMGAGLVAAFRAVPWAASGLAYARSRRGTGATRPRIGLSVLVALLLVAVFGALFVSADPVFARVAAG